MNKYKHLLCSFLVIFIFFLAGCARIKPSIEELPKPKLEKVFKDIAQNTAILNDFSGSGTIVFQCPDIQSAAGIKIHYLSPDFLRLTLSGLFGLHIGEFILAEGQYSASYLSSNNTMTGKIEDFSVADEFGLPIRSEDLIDLFLPIISLQEKPKGAVLHVDSVEQKYVLTWKDEENNHRLWVDPQRMIAVKELLMSPEGEIIWYKELEKVGQYSDVILASVWNVQLGSGEGSYIVKLRLPKISVNRGFTPADFIPAKPVIPDSSVKSLGE